MTQRLGANGPVLSAKTNTGCQEPLKLVLEAMDELSTATQRIALVELGTRDGRDPNNHAINAGCHAAFERLDVAQMRLEAARDLLVEGAK